MSKVNYLVDLYRIISEEMRLKYEDNELEARETQEGVMRTFNHGKAKAYWEMHNFFREGALRIIEDEVANGSDSGETSL